MTICENCGLPREICVCADLDKAEARILVRRDFRKYRKPVTVISGIDDKKTLQQLRRKLACGGAIKKGLIILQGDHREVIKKVLSELGISEERVEVI